MDDLKKLLKFIFVFGLINYVTCQDLAINKNPENFCVGRTVTLKCDPTPNTNYTIAIDESFYAVKGPSSIGCEYVSGDCRENVKINVPLNAVSFTYTASQLVTLSSCSSKKAEYLHIRYKCIPTSSRIIPTYNICEDGDITSDNGFIISPSYPTYASVPNQCLRKINAPANKVIKLRFLDMQIKNPDATNKCPNDFVKIFDSTQTFTTCGNDRPSYDDQLCSSVVYVGYQAATTNPLLLKGFKIYYEFALRSSQPDCPTGTPSQPPTPTTPATTTMYIPVITDLVASPIQSIQVCRGQSKVLTPYRDYLLFIIDSVYGVPGSLQCEAFSSSHCTAPAAYNCPFSGDCSVSLFSDIPVGDCASQNAAYLFLNYRFLPLYSSKNYSICDGGNVDGSQNTYGILTSRNYPNWEPNVDCAKRINALAGNIIRVYFTDISIDPKDQLTFDCKNSFVSLGENGRDVKYCGTRTPGAVYWYQSCSNTLDVRYKSSSQNANYRGFNMYYEVVPANGVQCPENATTPRPTTTTTTISSGSSTTQPDISKITSQILTEGGNGFGQPCVFPFKKGGQLYETCINDGQPGYWCATTANYDTDGLYGFCKLGLTTTVNFDLCPNKIEQVFCPKGHLIYIVAAEFGITSDGSCNYNKKTCSANAISSVKVTAGLQQSSIIHSQRALDNCQNQRSNFLHVDFACVPDTAPGYNVFNIGTDTIANGTRGIIQSRGYPSYQANLKDSLLLNVNGDNKFVNIYNVNTYMQNPTLSQVCQNDKIIINDAAQEPLIKCGNEKSDLYFQSCAKQINISIATGATGSSLYKGSKLFFEVVDKDPSIICPLSTLPTTPTTTQSTTSGTGPTQTTTTTTTTRPNLPQYVIDGVSSPTDTKAVCKNGIGDILNPPKITCPSTYIISIRRAFYGISSTNECFYREGDCISFKDNPATRNCQGKESCTFIDFGTNLPECNNRGSTYLQVEYDCIPTDLPVKSMCGQTFTDRKGIIKTPLYPSYENLLSCTATITTTLNVNIIKAYIIDMSINENCDTDRIIMYDSFNLTTASYCGTQISTLAIETCNSQLTINIASRGTSDPALRGAIIYYEAFPKPANFICSAFVPTTTRTTTSTTAKTNPSSSTSTRPANYGLALLEQELITCSSTTISCPNDYVIILLSTEYATNDIQSSGCAFSPVDCFETTTSFNLGCSGKQSCPVSYFSRQLSTCGKKQSKYLYITYQCVPVINAGKPNPNPNYNICDSGDSINVDSSIIIQSPGFPTYPSTDARCSKKIKTAPNKALKVYFTQGGFRSNIGSVNCNNSNDYVKVSDCSQNPPPLCGSTLSGKLVMQSVTNEIQIDFSATGSPPNTLYKGFQMYIEAVPSTATCVTEPPFLTTPPNDYIGFLSPKYHTDICALSERTLQCPPDYYVLVDSEHFVYTGVGCQHSDNECDQPTDLAYQKCSSQQKCTIFLPNTPLIRCLNKNADYLDIEHYCLPASLPSIKTYSCDDKKINADNGFIQSKNYPSYPTGANCEIEVVAKAGYGYNLFIVDFVLGETDVNGNCTDYLQVNGDDQLCGYDQPRLIQTSQEGLKIYFKALTQATESLRGFKLYFEAFSLKPTTQTTMTTSRRTFTTRLIQRTTIVNAHHSHSLTGWSLGLGIPVLIIVVALILFLNRRQNNGGYETFSSNSVNNASVGFTKKNNDFDDIKSFDNPNFSNE